MKIGKTRFMKKKSLFSLVVSLALINYVSFPVLAQSQRYPTDAELKKLSQEFQQEIIPIAKRSRQFGMGERHQALEAFTRAWLQSDSAIAPFLGSWNSNEDDLMIYPSIVRGRVCVIWTLPAGSNKVEGFFSIGSVSNGKVRVRSSGWHNNFFSSGGVLIRQGNYLGIASIDNNQPKISLFSAFSDPLKEIEQLPLANRNRVLQQFKDAGCTASLPKI